MSNLDHLDEEEAGVAPRAGKVLDDDTMTERLADGQPPQVG